MRVGLRLVAAAAWCALAGVASAQLGDSSFDQLDHPAIQYSTRPARDPVAALNRRIQAGDLQLSFDTGHGYLRSLLQALEIPIESQVAVFSKTSMQLNQIHPRNPRTIYFTDSIAVAWIRGSFVLEVAAQDPAQGTMFYEMDQRPTEKPTLRQTRACLRCHHSLYTNGVPGVLVRSTPTAADGTAQPWTKNLAMSHRTPFDQRWGGWYVTGRTSGLSHTGNVFATSPTSAVERSPDLETLEDRFDTAAYLTPYSDVVALLVLEHQTHVTNLLTRLGWEARAAAFELQAGGSKPQQPLPGRAPFSIEAAVNEIVDYLLFVDGAAAGTDPRHVRLCRAVRRTGAVRRPGPLAATARPRAQIDALSVQLHDLLSGLRRIARPTSRGDLQTHVADPRWQRSIGQVRTALRQRSPRHCADPSRHEEGIARRLPPLTASRVYLLCFPCSGTIAGMSGQRPYSWLRTRLWVIVRHQ